MFGSTRSGDVSAFLLPITQLAFGFVKVHALPELFNFAPPSFFMQTSNEGIGEVLTRDSFFVKNNLSSKQMQTLSLCATLNAIRTKVYFLNITC